MLFYYEMDAKQDFAVQKVGERLLRTRNKKRMLQTRKGLEYYYVIVP